jgi:hypothetical protein
MNRFRVWLALCGSVATLAGAGCGTDAPRLVPFAGTVAVGEQPVPAGSLQLRADVVHGNRSLEVPVSLIGPDGRFEVETGGKKGAPPGWWKVVVLADNFQVVDPPPSPVWPLFPEGHEPPKPLVHPRYLNPGTSDVSVEIVPGTPGQGHVLKLNP